MQWRLAVQEQPMAERQVVKVKVFKPNGRQATRRVALLEGYGPAPCGPCQPGDKFLNAALIQESGLVVWMDVTDKDAGCDDRDDFLLLIRPLR